MAAHVLVVDDDPAERRHIEEILKSLGYAVECADGGEAALARLSKAGAPPVSAVILDLVMPDLDGMAVLERLQRQSLSLPVIVQTAPGGRDMGSAAIRAGALDFLVKPATSERVKVSLLNALRIGALEGEILKMRMSRAGMLSLGDIVMHAPAMERVNQLAERAARSATPVLIEGERGVGKELLARAIHGSGPRRSRPFVAVRCGNLDAVDIASHLFGDAGDGDRPGGKLGEAAGGTLFLDEIGALPRDVQARLASILEEQAPGRQKRVEVRLMAATGRRLIELVGAEGFDQDLFHRLNAFPIWIPPLRERQSDIPHLARGFLARFAAEGGRLGITGISMPAMGLLLAHPWPGNVRELEGAIFRAVMLAEGGELTPREFPSLSAEPVKSTGLLLAAAAAPVAVAVPLGVALEEQFRDESPARADRMGPSRYGVARLLDERGEMRPFGTLEEEVIRFAIGHYGGRLSEVARRLGIGRSTLYRKIKDYGIAPGEPVVS